MDDRLKSPKVYLEHGEAKCILIEIIKYVDQQMPQSFRYQLYPWKRAYRNAEVGFGGIIGFSMNSERLKIFDYSDVMFYDKIVLIVLQGYEFTFRSIQDLKGKKVGIQNGASYGDEFEKGRNTFFFVEEDSSGTQRLLKLLAKRIDVDLLSPGEDGVKRIINQDKTLIDRQDELVILSEPFKRDPNYLGFTKTLNMQEFLQEFNKVLKKGHQSGAIFR
jgi:polar amino acid transport system substrate-binding protein